MGDCNLKNGSILIISDNESNGKFIAEKVKLLRDCDSINVVTYIEAISVLNLSMLPSLMIVYCANNDSIGIIKGIRTLKRLDKVPIILVLDYYAEEQLLYAFDNGIDDFFFMNDSDSVILMRILFTIKKSMLYKQLETSNNALVTAGIIEQESGIYLQEQTSTAFKQLFINNLESGHDSAVFMCVAPVIQGNKKLNMQQLAKQLKTVPRSTDIVAYGKDSTFYFVLYNAGVVGAKSVFSRIKEKLSKNNCDVFVSAAEITAPFETMESVLLQSLKEQIIAGIEFSYLYDLSLTETDTQAIELPELQESGESERNFKNLKQEFHNELEKIVAPVFYQMQMKITEMFPFSKISFDITETESRFTISKEKIKSELVITYPSYVKLLINIKHTTGSKRPQVKRQTYDIEDFSSEKLLSILQNIVKEFAIRLKSENSEQDTDADTK